jgi:hypothetical protein
MINLREHASSSYAPRTWYNASQGVTLALAVDFNTAGERLTIKAAQKMGIVHADATNFATDWIRASRELYKMLKETDCRVVNVAGNGIYTYTKHGFTQQGVNHMVHTILKQVNDHWKLDHVVSGGQSGADLAGLIAAAHLDIDCTGMWPRGYKMRFQNGVDVNHTQAQIMEIINQYA